MGRNTQLIRQWRILRRLALHRYGCRLEDLAADFEVSSRTVRRDLQSLEDAGFPVRYSLAEDGPRWRLADDPVTHRLLGKQRPKRVDDPNEGD